MKYELWNLYIIQKKMSFEKFTNITKNNNNNKDRK